MQRRFAALIILFYALQAEPRSVGNRVIFAIPLERLVQTSDVIAQVRIVAVDEEISYPPLARAKVEESFKGTKADDVLLIDAWSVSEVGSVFLMFLDDTHEPVRTRLRSGDTTFVSDPEAPYYTIPEGLVRQMPVRLTSAFGRRCGGELSGGVRPFAPESQASETATARSRSRDSRSAESVVSNAPREKRRLTQRSSRLRPSV